nr:ribonuclease H-like domain-containing protein [Tanacetum cinerariifolium]
MAWDDTIITNTTSISPLPKSPFLALQNPHWNNAMHDEYNELVKNGTWILVPRPAVANGSSQQLGIDCDETFSPDPTLYRSLAGGLQYLTFTRPDISYAVQQICLYMHDPREPQLAALKRILCYIRGTLDFGFHLYSSTTISLVGYTDTDWACCLSTRRSTSGYCVFLETTSCLGLISASRLSLVLVLSQNTEVLPMAINEDERLARAINGLCDGLTTAIEEKEKYILPPLQCRW